MTEAFKVLRYELIADDGSGGRLIQLALPGREFETAEALQAEGLIKREFRDGKWTRRRCLRRATRGSSFGRSTPINRLKHIADSAE
jgi:hypothetical protein